jgi:hypothetical protein
MLVLMIDLAWLSPLCRYVTRDRRRSRRLQVTNLCPKISHLQRFDAGYRRLGHLLFKVGAFSDWMRVLNRRAVH